MLLIFAELKDSSFIYATNNYFVVNTKQQCFISVFFSLIFLTMIKNEMKERGRKRLVGCFGKPTPEYDLEKKMYKNFMQKVNDLRSKKTNLGNEGNNLMRKYFTNIIYYKARDILEKVEFRECIDYKHDEEIKYFQEVMVDKMKKKIEKGEIGAGSLETVLKVEEKNIDKNKEEELKKKMDVFYEKAKKAYNEMNYEELFEQFINYVENIEELAHIYLKNPFKNKERIANLLRIRNPLKHEK